MNDNKGEGNGREINLDEGLERSLTHTNPAPNTPPPSTPQEKSPSPDNGKSE